MPKLSKIQVCYFFEIFQEKYRLKLKQISLKVSFKLIQWFLLGWTRIPKISKTESLECLAISHKRSWRDEVDFLHADKHFSFYKLAFWFLMEVTRHVESTQNKKLVIFLQCLKKRIFNFVCGEQKLCIQKVTRDKFF